MNLRQEISQLYPALQMDGQELTLVVQNGYLCLGRLQKTVESSIKTYAATISQTGTAAPVAKVLANTIGLPVWTRFDVNNYDLTLVGAFPADRTVINQGVDIDGNYYRRLDDDTVRFFCAGGNGTITDYPVKVEVYWYLITDVPQNVLATVVDEQEIDLSWDTGADNYILEYSLDEGFWIEIYNGALGVFNHTGLDPSTEYFYRIKAETFGELDSDYVFTSATTDPAP